MVAKKTELYMGAAAKGNNNSPVAITAYTLPAKENEARLA